MEEVKSSGTPGLEVGGLMLTSSERCIGKQKEEGVLGLDCTAFESREIKEGCEIGDRGFL